MRMYSYSGPFSSRLLCSGVLAYGTGFNPGRGATPGAPSEHAFVFRQINDPQTKWSCPVKLSHSGAGGGGGGLVGVLLRVGVIW